MRTVLIFIVIASIPLWVLVWDKAGARSRSANPTLRRQWESSAAAGLIAVLVATGHVVAVTGRDTAAHPAYSIPEAVLAGALFLIAAWRARRGYR